MYAGGSMVRYYFDIHDGIDLWDEAGTELSDIEAARAHAISCAARYVSDLDGDGRGGFIVVTIRDADSTLLTLRLVCHIETSGSSAVETIHALRRQTR